MKQSDAPVSEAHKRITTGRAQPLNFIVGDHRVSPCDHETFERFKLWVAKSIAQRKIETYNCDNVMIEHWGDQGGDRYGHLLNPCECGTYLPMEIDPTPMVSSSIGLLSDLSHLKSLSMDIPADYRAIIDIMMQMAELSLETNTALEIK